ncbi:MAG TPA: excinuclease ABC subunit UvrC [Oscillospiraceae bacterium]|nr:excinuclease ABC subunit UvrC [Oscillospiraceae bacterium]
MEENSKRLKRLKTKANMLPETPGVYIMKNKVGGIIYIGKAKSLKNRVTQYFSQKGQDIKKVQIMVDNVCDFDYILTDNEFEALVLECSLIKQHKPKYNILLKDDKGYHYIKIIDGEWKNFVFSHQKLDDGAYYLGPYTREYLFTRSVHDAKKIFRLPTCSKEFPRDIGKSRPCLNYHIKQCSAPCAGKIGKHEFNKCVDDAIAFIKGTDKTVVREIEEKMKRAAKELDFERAAILRDRLVAIKKMTQKQKIVSTTHPEQDVMAFAAFEGKVCFAVLRFSGGRLCDTNHFIFDELSNEAAMRASFISAYYEIKDRVPKRITVDGKVEGLEVLEQYLSEKRGTKTVIALPQIGKQAKLVEMCRNNALQKLTEHVESRINRELDALLELQGMLKLENTPRYIEAYDISHTGGTNAVGGMVVFKDGKPYKKAYRRFAIKSFEGQDDYRALFEVLDRRFSEYEKAEDLTEGFGVLPDLILVDGGKGQVKAAREAIKQHNIEIPLFGMVKNAKHRTDAIVTEEFKVGLSVKHRAFTLVTNIQDEVHRFAISYHKKKRSKSAVSSTLCEIQGVGEARAKALIRHFKSMKNIKEASIEELKDVKGISLTVAENVFKAFHPEQ